MNYDEVVERLQTLLEIPLNNTDENFERILPSILDYADNRIYRELNFLATLTAQVTALTINDRNLALPTTVIVLRGINVITPVATLADAGKRNPLERVSIDALDFFWPSAALTPGVPQKYSLIGTSTQTYTVRFSPTPDAAYNAEFIGVIRPTVISAANQTTYICNKYPELYIAACMVFGCGYQRDFGLQNADPAKAVSWESVYTTLREGATVEALEQKSESVQWSATPPTQLANQPRDRAQG